VKDNEDRYMPDDSEEQEVEKKKATKDLKMGCIGCCSILFVAVIFVLIMVYCSSKNGTVSKPSILDLKASVHYTGTQFIITNQDSSDWLNVEMKINAGLLGGGYSMKYPIMEAGRTYTFDAVHFAKSDGTRFSFLTVKPHLFSIYSRDRDDIKGRIKGSYHAQWK